MTVAELITALAAFDPQMLVVLDGYEGDADDIVRVASRLVVIDGNMLPRHFGFGSELTVPHDVGMGRHRFADEEGDDGPLDGAIKVVWLKREHYRGEYDDDDA